MRYQAGVVMDLTKDTSKATNLTIALVAIGIIGLGGGLGFLLRGDGKPDLRAQSVKGLTANPLEPFERGYVQCLNIDVAAKTCEGISSFVDQGDGTWSNASTSLLDPRMPWTFTIAAPVFIKDGNVCGVLRPVHFDEYKVDYGDMVPSSSAQATVKSLIDERLALFVNKLACAVYYEDLGATMVKTTIDGIETNYPHKRVRWVLPSEGYRVAPRHPIR